MDTERPAVLVVCIGNELIADDAVGYEVWKKLKNMRLPDQARLEYASVGGISLLDLLTGGDGLLIVVDAVQLGAPPGTVHRLSWDELPPSGASAISAHGVGLREAIDIGTLLFPEKMPQRALLVGIEGRCFNRTRDAMTRETEDAIGKAVSIVYDEITTYCRGVSDEKRYSSGTPR